MSESYSGIYWYQDPSGKWIPSYHEPIGIPWLPYNPNAAPDPPTNPYGPFFGPLGPDEWDPQPPLTPLPTPKAPPPRVIPNSVARPIEYRLGTATAKDTPIPIIYGRDKVGARLLAATIVGTTAESSKLLISVAWCLGEVESVEKVFINDVSANTRDISGAVAITTYLGTTTQGVDPILAANITDYADDNIITMPNGDKIGVCYTMALLGPLASDGFPTMTAIIKGAKVYDPREAGHDADDRSTWEWSDNPALHINDFIQSENYGAYRDVDQNTVSTLADRNDKIIDVDSSTVLRSLNLTLDKTSKTEVWIETLRGYAACFVVQTNDGIALIPDAPTSVTASITASNIVAGSFKPILRGLLNNPTVLKLTYTQENSVTEWTDEIVEVSAFGVADGTVPRIVSDIHLPGIHSHQQALREATIRFNHFHAEDLEVTFDTFDEGLKRLEGDVIHVNHPIGISQNVRVTKVTNPQPGRWQIACVEYQPAVYSSLVIDKALNPDTNLPDPTSVPTITGLAATEELYQIKTGDWRVRLRIKWDDPAGAYPFSLLYTVQLIDHDLGKVVWTDTGNLREIITPSLRDLSRDRELDLTYSVICHAHTDNGFIGAEQQIEITTLGKTAIPGDVPDIDGYELAGEVRLYWSAATDLDIIKYEIRYGATINWDDMTVLDRISSLRANYTDIPEGTWFFAVKAIDSIVQYSANAAWVQVIVTLNTEAYLKKSYDFNSGGSNTTHVHEYQKDRVDDTRQFITFDGSSMASSLPNALNTYTEPLAAHHGPVAAVWESSTIDMGSDIAGNYNITYVSGFTLTSSLGSDVSAVLQLAGTNSAGTNWIESSGLSIGNSLQYSPRSYRFAKFRVESNASATMRFTIPRIRMRIDAHHQEENGAMLTNTSRKVLDCDSSAYAVFSNSSAVNLQADGYTEKTLEATFITGASVESMQIIYEQGNVSVGMNIGVETGILWGNVYDHDNDKYIHVQTSILPNTQYAATLRFKSSTLTMALNGVSVTQYQVDPFQEIPSILPVHSGSCCIGGMQGGTYFVGAFPGDGYIFSGKIFRVTQYNRYLTDSEVSANAVKSSIASGAVMDYDCDDGASDILFDQSIESNDAIVSWGASGTNWATKGYGKVTITKNKYFEADRITLLPQSSNPRILAFDNIVFGHKTSWLTYAWDEDIIPVAVSVAWTFKGL